MNVLNYAGSLLAGLLALSFSGAQAQTFPQRPVTLIVPYAAGGPVDIAGRTFAEALTKTLGQQVVVENKAGAGGMSGTRFAAAANPDGYTLLLGSSGPLIIAPAASPGLIDIDARFKPVSLVADSPQVLVVNSKLPIKSLQEFVDHARGKPEGLNYGSAGIGTTPHLSAEMLARAASIKLVHVPYRGTSAAVPDLVSGELQFLFGDIATLAPFIEAKSISALAVTGTRRSNLLPQTPTTAEAEFPSLLARNFYAVLAPAGIAPAIVETIARRTEDAKADRNFVERMEKQGMALAASSPQHASEYIQEERKLWTPVIQAIGLKLGQ